MKKITLPLIAMSLVLAGCEPSMNTPVVNIPKELEGCTYHEWNPEGHRLLYVVRCPNSITSTISSGKHQKTVITIDGVEYEKVSDR